MKLKLVLGIAVAAAVTAAFAGPAAWAGPPQPPPIPTGEPPYNPWPAGKKLPVFFFVETLTASPNESIYGKNAPGIPCTQTNYFARGERVVWHISAVNALNGKLLLPPDVKYMYLKVPGMDNIKVTYVRHGRDPATAPWSWTARWDVPLNYPLGQVPYQLVIKLKDWVANKTFTWTQFPLALENLTIIDHR